MYVYKIEICFITGKQNFEIFFYLRFKRLIIILIYNKYKQKQQQANNKN
jgi:hypothetical protein